MVTSLSTDDATVQELATLYTARWAIELQFRGLKKEANLKSALNRITNPDHIYAITISALIAHLLTMQYWNFYYPVLEKSGRMLSLEKLISNVVIMLSGMKNLADLEFFDPDLRHLAYEKRANRPAFVNQAFKPLS